MSEEPLVTENPTCPECNQIAGLPHFRDCPIGKRLEAETNKITQAVEHPKHYGQHPSGVECIEIVQWMSFNTGTAVKHLWRAGLKDQNPTIQDLRKAIKYIEFEIARIEKMETTSDEV